MTWASVKFAPVVFWISIARSMASLFILENSTGTSIFEYFIFRLSLVQRIYILAIQFKLAFNYVGKQVPGIDTNQLICRGLIQKEYIHSFL